MVDSSDVSKDMYSVPLRRPLVLTDDELEVFLHRATIAVLCSDNVQYPIDIFRQIVQMAVARAKGHGAQDRASAEATIATLDKRLVERLKIRDELNTDLKGEIEARNEAAALANRAEQLNTQIRIKRIAELERRTAQAMTELDARRKEAVENQENVAGASFEQRQSQWKANAEERKERAEKLQQNYDNERPFIDAALDRALA